MATTTQLARIAALVQRLGPLAGKQRGMRIEAEEWNALVDVLRGVLEIDRTQEEFVQISLEERFAKKAHEHLGEVTIAWLDAELQASRGESGGSLSVRTALVDMQQKVQSLGAEVARLNTLLETQQKLLDRAAVDGVDRGKTLRAFEDRFAGVENLRTLVTHLSGQQDSLSQNVSTVLELRRTLSDAQGAPIDVNALRQDLTQLQTLQENLKGVDGSLIRIRDFELKLNELSDAVGVGGPGGLERRLGDLSGTIETRLNSRIDERAATLQATFADVTTASETRLRTELNASLAVNKAELDRATTDRIGAAESRLSADFTARAATAADTARRDSVAAAQALLDARFTEVPNQITTAVNAARAGIVDGLRGEFSGQITTQVQGQVAAAEARLTSRLTTTETQVGSLRQELPALVDARVADAGATLSERLSRSVAEQVAQARQGLEAGVNAQVKTAVTEGLSSLDARIATQVTQGLSGLDGRISQAVASATRDLPAQVGAEVQTQVTALNVPQQIETSSASVRQQLRAELSLAVANQQAQSTRAVNDAVGLLRAETDAKVKAGTEEAVQRSGLQLTNFRDEMNRTIDTRLQQTRDGLTRDFNLALTNEINRVSDSFRGEVTRIDTRLNPLIVRRPPG